MRTTGIWTRRTRTAASASGTHRGAGLRAAGRPQAARHPRHRDLRGHKIHSARWDHDYDFTGKRVAVIGTGASAVQIVPELVKQAVRQGLPAHSGLGDAPPGLETPAAAQTLFAKVPATQQLARQALFWGHEAIATALVWTPR